LFDPLELSEKAAPCFSGKGFSCMDKFRLIYKILKALEKAMELEEVPDDLLIVHRVGVLPRAVQLGF
jgi:hypothetical protein